MSPLIDWENVCLVCLRKGENRFIFEEDNDSNVIADKIMKCADILIKRDTNQPKNICLQCLDDLNVAYKFRRNCEQSDSMLKTLLHANHQEFQTNDLWKMTPITVENDPNHSEHNVCIKNESNDNGIDGDTFETIPCLDLKDDTLTEAKFIIKNHRDAPVDNVKVSKTNKIKQEVNCEISKRPRVRLKKLTEVSCKKSSLKPGYKRPLKICEICNRGLRGQNRFTVHMRRHNNERPFSCDHCEKAFVTRTELRRHVIVHTGQKPLKCKYCDRRFSDYGARKNHESTHTGEMPYKCSTCGKSFAYPCLLTVHLRTHTGEKKFVCKECGKGFMKRMLFEKHVAHHQSRDELGKLSAQKQKEWLEKEIFQIEENPNSNEINIKHEIVDNAVIDDNCKNEDTLCFDLEYDPDTSAKVDFEDRANAGNYSNAKELKKVKNTQSSKTEQEINCEISRRPRGRPKKSSDVSCAKAGLKSTYKRPLKICQICNRGLRGQNRFTVHMRRHNNERPFNCDHCDKAFVTRTELRSHMRVHTGQKRYKCQYCDLRFSDYDVRKNHESTHTGERPYVCPTCGKSFAYSKGLRKHLRTHTGEKQSIKKACVKKFAKNVLVEEHVAHHPPRDELDTSSEQLEEYSNSSEINIKHEVEFVEEGIN